MSKAVTGRFLNRGLNRRRDTNTHVHTAANHSLIKHVEKENTIKITCHVTRMTTTSSVFRAVTKSVSTRFTSQTFDRAQNYLNRFAAEIILWIMVDCPSVQLKQWCTLKRHVHFNPPLSMSNSDSTDTINIDCELLQWQDGNTISLKMSYINLPLLSV